MDETMSYDTNCTKVILQNVQVMEMRGRGTELLQVSR